MSKPASWGRIGSACHRIIMAVSGIPPFRRPSNDRDWAEDVAVFPEIRFHAGGSVTIRRMRNFSYRSVSDHIPAYYDRTVRVSQVESAWFIVEPFSLLLAHTMVSFGLDDGSFITVSVEIRKRKGQRFSQLPVLFFIRRHELAYVIGDERDLIGLRANHRKDDVYLYRTAASPEQAREMFVGMLDRAHRLQGQPEFYNPFTNTCLTNITDHANSIWPGLIPFSYEILAARFSDRLAYRLGLFGQEATFRKLKEDGHINDLARLYADREDFSRGIRERLS